MEQQQAPVMDQELRQKMDAAGTRAVAVTVTFREPMDDRQLSSLGLYGPSPRQPAALAYGRLTASAIRALAERPDVVRIRWTSVLPARPGEKAAMSKIESQLQRLMEKEPGITYNVIVAFTKPVDDEQVDALGLMPASPVEAVGQLTGDAIRALAARPDVARIRSSPKVKPS